MNKTYPAIKSIKIPSTWSALFNYFIWNLKNESISRSNKCYTWFNQNLPVKETVGKKLRKIIESVKEEKQTQWSFSSLGIFIKFIQSKPFFPGCWSEGLPASTFAFVKLFPSISLNYSQMTKVIRIQKSMMTTRKKRTEIILFTCTVAAVTVSSKVLVV